MSGRVNTKFVIGLSATLIAIIIGLVGVWYTFVRTNPAEYIARVDAMLAQGQYIKAVEYYRKARSGRPHDPNLMLKQAQALSQIPVQDTRTARAAIGQLIDLYKSVWGARAAWNDSGDLFDTDEVEMQRFANDWAIICSELKMANFIMRNDDHGDRDADGDGTADEIQEVQAVLWEFHDLIFVLFMCTLSLSHSLPRCACARAP